MNSRTGADLAQNRPDNNAASKAASRNESGNRPNRSCLRLSDVRRYMTSVINKTAQNAFKSIGYFASLFASPFLQCDDKSLMIYTRLSNE